MFILLWRNPILAACVSVWGFSWCQGIFSSYFSDGFEDLNQTQGLIWMVSLFSLLMKNFG